METTAVKTNWSVDPTHSEVQFKVKHLVISTVTGQFKEFSATLESEGENFEHAKATFSAQIDSITTNNNDRDGHLKSADFFDAANHPSLDFVSEKFLKTGDSTYDIIGNLSIRGVSKEIVLKAEFGGIMTDPYGNTKAGFEIAGKINRKDYGLNWSAVTEAGGVVVSDEVRLLLNLQFVKQA
ncbi:MAG: YceI family protein [Crocinitomicaceae bacterium]|jgi:polyisoprenoid-binding protein YceI|nr:YceI family protein [Crocinitomicaceae bacterium]